MPAGKVSLTGVPPIPDSVITYNYLLKHSKGLLAVHRGKIIVIINFLSLTPCNFPAVFMRVNCYLKLGIENVHQRCGCQEQRLPFFPLSLFLNIKWCEARDEREILAKHCGAPLQSQPWGSRGRRTTDVNTPPRTWVLSSKTGRRKGERRRKSWGGMSNRWIYVTDPIPAASRNKKSHEGKKAQRCRGWWLTVTLKKLNLLSK